MSELVSEIKPSSLAPLIPVGALTKSFTRPQQDSPLTETQFQVKLYIVPEIKLVIKVCKCGCKRTWKALPTSKNKYFSEIECPKQLKYQRLNFKSVPRKKF